METSVKGGANKRGKEKFPGAFVPNRIKEKRRKAKQKKKTSDSGKGQVKSGLKTRKKNRKRSVNNKKS